MLNVTIFLPLFTGLLILLLPSARPRIIRATALFGAALTLLSALALWWGYDPAGEAYQWRTTLPWIPSINAAYDIGVDGLSLPLIVLAAVLLLMAMIYVLRQDDRAKAHSFLFLLMGTGLIGLFSARDLLLFYVFFEVGLVPMYFIIGIWGHEERRYAAMKFFLYTRAGSLAMLLAFLGLYLSMEPHTFSLAEIVRAQPLAGAGPTAGLVLLGLVIGFGVKLPIFPLHNWLPDAHVEAPTEGSVMLAGVQLKMGAYGFLRIVLGAAPDAARQYGWLLLALGLVSLVYGALAAFGQRDLKRLIAYTSVNHMAYVLIGAAVFALAGDSDIRHLAFTGAAYQIVSHGLLTGGMFFMVGMLQDQAGTREMDRFGGLMTRMPIYSTIMGLLAFGSLGLPGFSGFIAEFQVVGATLSISIWAAVVTLLGLIVTTALYLKIVMGVLMGEVPASSAQLHEPQPLKLAVVASLAALSILLGILPGLLVGIIQAASRLAAGAGA